MRKQAAERAAMAADVEADREFDGVVGALVARLQQTRRNPAEGLPVTEALQEAAPETATQLSKAQLMVQSHLLGVHTLPQRGALSLMFRKVEGGAAAILPFIQIRARQDRDSECFRWWRRFMQAVRAKQIVTIEEVCFSVKLDIRRFLAEIVETAWDVSGDISSFMAAIAGPDIMEASITAAKLLNGMDDRKIHLQKTGFAPTPKGSGVTVNVDAKASAAAGAQAAAEGAPLPSFMSDMDDARLASGAAQKQLTEGDGAQPLDAEFVAEREKEPSRV